MMLSSIEELSTSETYNGKGFKLTYDSDWGFRLWEGSEDHWSILYRSHNPIHVINWIEHESNGMLFYTIPKGINFAEESVQILYRELM